VFSKINILGQNGMENEHKFLFPFYFVRLTDPSFSMQSPFWVFSAVNACPSILCIFQGLFLTWF
jgi:hypothetical protein